MVLPIPQKPFWSVKRKHVKLKLPTLLDGWTMYSYIYRCQLVLVSFLFVSHQAWTTPELESFGTLHWHWTLWHIPSEPVLGHAVELMLLILPPVGASRLLQVDCAPTDCELLRGGEKSLLNISGSVLSIQCDCLSIYIYFFSVLMFTPVFRVNQISSRFGWLIHLLLLRPVSRPY